MKTKRPTYRKKVKKTAPSTYTVVKEEPLLVSLAENLPSKSRKLLKAVLRDKQVLVEGKPVTQFDLALMPGQTVQVSWEKAQPRHTAGLDIIHEDDDLIIINKPAGLLTIATEKEKRKTAYAMLSSYLKKEDSEAKIFIIHRLDRETSGLLMFAKSEQVKREIQKSWNETISQRTYVGVVEGNVKEPSGTVTSYLTESSAFKVYSSQNPAHGKKAITRFTRLKSNDELSLLQMNLDTGRKHQIRVHMQDIGHPLVGDKNYGSGMNLIGRMALHAMVLEYTHPRTGETCHFETGVPQSFLKLFRPSEKNERLEYRAKGRDFEN